ncbi:conserved hypothetical protein [Luminiphilus syltensis NOR5-1B]|uniref:HupE / UreJ protein n=1 Tax=Luminiphilus syltensis NOR5-1B TaxID=565045 RepID=B8KXP2_9GAMM|nr:HupE/UreJ family protein [Luminiphilus syltensis]EED35016.1 conserved hypothetical protein [Luminiphilus syltensis NOR5-1B]
MAFIRVFLILYFMLMASVAVGHDARPIYVDIREVQQHQFAVQWKAPSSMPASGLPTLSLPSLCTQSGASVSGRIGGAYTVSASYVCTAGLAGQQLSLKYPGNNPGVNTLFRISLLNGEVRNQILQPGEETLVVAEVESLTRVSAQYAWLGIEHIFLGLDHLLFVLCLVFIARSPRRILVTITGFTVAHSLTLALSTLGFIQLPIPAVEAVIALSILFLAHEIAVADRSSWTWRYPVLVSSSFGLLHGFGFAAVLGDIGLPQTELPAALLFFNIGVELGQIAFITLLILGIGSVTLLLGRAHGALLNGRYTGLAGTYVIGTVASFWLLQRVSAFST